MLRAGRPFFVSFLIALFFVFHAVSGPVRAATNWSYTITAGDTPAVIDPASTAVVDTAENEIRLPINITAAVGLWPEGGYDYVVLAAEVARHYSFDGTRMVENTVTSMGGLTGALALAAPRPYPDVLVATASEVKYFSFTGSGMVYNPSLSVAGLTGVMAVGSLQSGSLAVLEGSEVRYYGFDGSSMVRMPVLEPSAAFTNPISLAVFPDGYDIAVLEPDRVRVFQFNGSGMMENPALAVTGLTGAKAFAVSAGQIAVVDGNKVKHYSFDGSRMTYNSVLSVTAGLTAPTGVALRSGTFDRVIVDGGRVRYFSFDGTQMTEVPQLSVTFPGGAGEGYLPAALAVSRPADPVENAASVRVRAYHDLPEGTSVTWSVTADGVNWSRKWRVRGLSGGLTVAEVTGDNGLTWNPIGDALQASPAYDRQELWADVDPGRSVRWMAELATADPAVTPKIRAPVPGQTAVAWEANTRPLAPVIIGGAEWYYTTTPTFYWQNTNPGPGGAQTSFQVLVRTDPAGNPVYDSGRVVSSLNSFTIPTSQAPGTPGPLWQSGTYRFTVEVRIWNSMGVASDWSAPHNFRILAFERPRIAEIVNPPPGQAAPDPGNPATWIMITPGMTADLLPKVKAGARATLVLDSVGPVNTRAENIAVFPYGAGQTAVMESASSLNAPGSAVNRWTFSFWTDPNPTVAPTGAVIQLQAAGTGTEGGNTFFNLPPYAAGVAAVDGSIYSDWFVVLQGSDR